jgi:hypothetical protein
MTSAIALSIVLALAATAAHAEIYTCTGKHRMTVYQNFPCEFDSLGSMPTPMSKGAAPDVMPAPAPATVKAASSEKRTPIKQAMPAPAVPRVGMKTEEVKAIWGEPMDASKEEFADGDVEIWTYADSRSVRFDHKGRVTAIHSIHW